MVSEPWGTEAPDIHADADVEMDIPLQYRKLFAESSPTEGRVLASRLNALLHRTGIAPELCARILEHCAPSGKDISEEDFYRAIGAAANVVNARAHVPLDLDPTSIDSSEGSGVVNTSNESDGEGSDRNPKIGSDNNAVTGAVLNFDPPFSAIQLSEETSVVDLPPVPLYPMTLSDSIRVTQMTELQGSYLFRHVVYTIDGVYKDQPVRVVRRYRDFVWLLDCLVKRFPFRALPLLPPKRFGVDGKHLAKLGFLEKRCAGLQRFINLLVAHPVVGDDLLVSLFLTVTSGIEVIKHQAVFDNEFGDRKISPLFISQWDASHQQRRWRTIKEGVDESLHHVTAICMFYERQIQRELQMSEDEANFQYILDQLSDSLLSTCLDKREDDDLLQIRNVTQETAISSEARSSRHHATYTRLMNDLLPQLRRLRDILLMIRELYGRYHQFGSNTISALERRIESTQRKLVTKANSDDVKPEELDRLRQRILDAQSSIAFQTNRDWLIKETMSRELESVQSVQYQVAVVLRKMSGISIESHEAFVELGQELDLKISELPNEPM